MVLSRRFAVVLTAAMVSSAGLVLASGLYDQPQDQPRGAPVDPAEAFPGGAATSPGPLDRRAFSQHAANLPFDQQLDFEIGNALFDRIWASAPASTQASDGLGPLFNAKSCQQCHIRDGRGHTPSANYPDDNAVSMVLRLSIPPTTEAEEEDIASGRRPIIPEPTYGAQLQDRALPGHAIEGRMHLTYEEVSFHFPDGEVASLRRRTYAIEALGYGPLHPQTRLSPRVAPPMIGLGLLEAIAEADIRALADPDDRDGDGISGRVNEVWSLEFDRPMLGRFGWKAVEPTLVQQSAHAFSGDIGLSSWIARAPWGDCTAAQPVCLEAPHGDSPQYGNLEIADKMMGPLVLYVRNLAVPARRDVEAETALQGRELFADLGCASCHTPSFTTGSSPRSAHLAHQKIWPYTDLLLHDMGEGLADGRDEGHANGREWRTAPLWGIGLTETVNGHTFFLHDGRARNLTEAILWHGGEAQRSRDGFVALTKSEREALLAFLNSL